MIKAVIFDYGGVILKMSSSWRYANFLSRFYNLPKSIIKKKASPSLALLQKGIISENEFWERISSALRRPVPKNKGDAWRKCLQNDFHIYPEMTRFVKKIRSKGFKTAVLSNTIESHLGVIRNPLAHKDFDVEIFSCRVGARKPELKIYKILLKKLKVKPEECIFIDDLNENLKPAKKLGMRVILAKNPKQIIHNVQKILG
jgi:epoxide hydrolase-like predicted phosphatase